MESIVFLAIFIPVVVAMRSTPGKAFLQVYLPALLLLPDTYHTTLQGIPKLSFNQAVAFGLFPLVLLRYVRRWRFTFNDFLVLALVGVIATSEYQAAGYKEAQNLTIATVCSVLAPYLMARLVIPAEQLYVATARRYVWMVFIVSVVSLYEFRFGYDIFLELWKPLFRGQGEGWVVTFRYGFARVAGPYAHAILAGVIAVSAYRLQRWLEWGGYWEPRFGGIGKGLPWPKARVITSALLLFALATLARGPWLGGLIGGVLVMIGRSHKRKAMMTQVLVVACVVVPIAYTSFTAYLDVKPGEVMTQSQESAVYRKELMEKYTNIAEDKLPLGWGRNTWPKVPGMPSIDNYFLLLTLMHGAIATSLFLGLFAWGIGRLFQAGMAEPVGTPSLSFAFAGIQIAALVSLVTVYLGENLMPALFLLFGWAESHLQVPYQQDGPAKAPTATGWRFRVLR